MGLKNHGEYLKHILNKHTEAVEKAKGTVGFFNNYVRDIFRCRTLPVAAQRPGGTNGGILRPPMMSPMMGGGPPMGMMPPPMMRDPSKRMPRTRQLALLGPAPPCGDSLAGWLVGGSVESVDTWLLL